MDWVPMALQAGVPAVITAGAMLGQQAVSGAHARRSARDHRDHEDRRAREEAARSREATLRDERRSAYRALLAEGAAIYEHVGSAVGWLETLPENAGLFLPGALPPLDRTLEALEVALAEVLVTASADTAVAAQSFRSTLVRLGAQVELLSEGDQPRAPWLQRPDREQFQTAVADYRAARMSLIAAARADLGIPG